MLEQKTIKLYTGNEQLEHKGKKLPYSMLQFWQLSLSDILFNMNRGTFAEYIVRCALSEGGFDALNEENGTIRVWDITGPNVPSEVRPSKIEVKSAASVQKDTPEKKEVSLRDTRLVFSSRPAIDEETKKEGRHSDLYVFCHYKATRKEQNILDMDLWDFYVYPTFKIDDDPILNNQNSISLYRIKKLGVIPVSFEALYDEIMRQISIVSEHLSLNKGT